MVQRLASMQAKEAAASLADAGKKPSNKKKTAAAAPPESSVAQIKKPEMMQSTNKQHVAFILQKMTALSMKKFPKDDKDETKKKRRDDILLGLWDSVLDYDFCSCVDALLDRKSLCAHRLHLMADICRFI